MPLIIKGRISGDEERKSVRAEDIVQFKDARNYYKKVFINCNNDALAETDLKELQKLMSSNRGECEVWFKINGKNEQRRVRSRSFKIKPLPEVLDKIRNIVGSTSLKIYGKI
jgi:hypothetical protein